MNDDDSELIDDEWARETFLKEPFCYKLPVEDYYLYQTKSGPARGTWNVFYEQADGNEVSICYVVTRAELANVLRLINA